MAKRKSVVQAPTTPSLLNTTIAYARDYGPSVGLTALAATGFWYGDLATPVLNFLGSFTGASLNSLAGQVTAVAAEGALAVGALKSTLWSVGRIRKASELEKVNTNLNAQLQAANKTNQAWEKRETDLKKAQDQLRSAKESLKQEKAQHTKDKKATATKAHDAAKKLDELDDVQKEMSEWHAELYAKEALLNAKEEELNALASELEALQSSSVHEEKSSSHEEKSSSHEEKSSSHEEKSSSSEPVNEEELKLPATVPAAALEAGITVNKQLVASFERSRSSSRDKLLVLDTPPAEEAAASIEKSRSRSPSPLH